MGAMLFGISNEGIFAYAMTNQSVTAVSGYRIYADSLTSASGVIKGDVSELQPDYKVSHVVLPDGNTSAAEEVSYSITESGDYTFEVVYETVPEDKQMKINLDLASLQGKETTEEKISEKAEPEENVQSEKSQDITSEIPITEETEIDSTAIEKAAKEAKEASKSEKLTLTVTLPEAEEKADASAETTAEQEATQTEGSISSQPLTSFVPSTLSNASQSTAPSTRSVMSESNARASYGGYDYDTKKKWSSSDFGNSLWMITSYDHMNYGGDMKFPMKDDTLSIENNSQYGAMVRFGKKYGTDYDYARYLQQGVAFSNIKFDFTKDFVLVGNMRIGNMFGAEVDAINTTDIKIDGGVTVSFIPQTQVENAKNLANLGRSPAYRLGAYGSLPKSIVCEFDSSTDTYYAVGRYGDNRRFIVSKDEYDKVGDYKYSSDSQWTNDVAGKDLYENAKEDGTTKYGNVAHIGISTTDANAFVASQSNSTDRCALGTSNTGNISYSIKYKASSNTLIFSITEAKNSAVRTVEMKLTTYLNGLSDSDKKAMNLAFTFGAAYLDIDSYLTGSFFGSGGGTGQIDIYANELYVSPNLETTKTKVKWLESPTTTVNDSATYVAYNNAQNYNDRKYWPVAGDRVYAQFSFNPVTDVMPQPGSAQSGKLKLSVGDLKIANSSGTAISELQLGSTEIYYRVNKNGSTGTWQKYSNNSTIDVTLGNTIDVRVKLNLPALTDESTINDYHVSGIVYANYSVGSSSAEYQIPLMSENGKKISVSRRPKFIGWNGVDYYKDVRVIKSTGDVEFLRFTSNDGNKDGTGASGDGKIKSIHYGVGYRLFSTNGEYYIYQDRNSNKVYDVKKFSYKTATMDNLSLITDSGDITNDSTDNYDLNFSEDRRFVLEYRLQDPNYMKQNGDALTGNPDRGKTTGKRVIWASDNVQTGDGYEFYAKQEVTMSKQDFANFSTAPNKGDYYRKIAKAAGAKVFKTANYDFDDLIDGNYTNTSLSGNGNHDGVNNALASPGTPQDVTLQYQDSSGNKCYRTIKLTIQDDTPKVVSNANGNTITDQAATKIIFDKEDYSVSATFKLANSDGSNITLNNVSWADVKGKIKVALYKRNGTNATGNNDKFYRWANNTAATNQAKESAGTITKVQLPVTIQQNITNGKFDGTFTVTYKLLNSSSQSTSANWIQKTWEDGAQWKILAWTDSNKPSKNYSNLNDTATDTIGISESITDVPTVTTKIELIEKSNGSLPATMFRISDVQLNDDGNELSDKRNTTTVSLESIDGLTDEQLKTAQHDYYYEVHVNESNADSQSRPYTTLTQSDTKKSFNVTYLKYTSNKNSYSDVKKANTLLGSIAYPSNGKSLPQYIRFGMRADRQTGITSNQKFVGQANFKFVRKSLSGGANP